MNRKNDEEKDEWNNNKNRENNEEKDEWNSNNSINKK